MVFVKCEVASAEYSLQVNKVIPHTQEGRVHFQGGGGGGGVRSHGTRGEGPHPGKVM